MFDTIIFISYVKNLKRLFIKKWIILKSPIIKYKKYKIMKKSPLIFPPKKYKNNSKKHENPQNRP
jgi:hypothetical protein